MTHVMQRDESNTTKGPFTYKETRKSRRGRVVENRNAASRARRVLVMERVTRLLIAAQSAISGLTAWDSNNAFVRPCLNANFVV